MTQREYLIKTYGEHFGGVIHAMSDKERKQAHKELVKWLREKH